MKKGDNTVAEFDMFELIESVDDGPAGARGWVLELGAYDTAMVKITEPPFDAAAGIMFHAPRHAQGRIPAIIGRWDGSFLEASFPAKPPSDDPQPH